MGVPEVFEETDARKSVEVDFALIEHYDSIIRDIENHMERQVKKHDPQGYHRLRTTPGIGKILVLTILYEIHDIERFPRVQDFLSYSRLVKCDHTSAGKKLGTGASKIGRAVYIMLTKERAFDMERFMARSAQRSGGGGTRRLTGAGSKRDPGAKPEREACERSGDLCDQRPMASWSMPGIRSA